MKKFLVSLALIPFFMGSFAYAENNSPASHPYQIILKGKHINKSALNGAKYTNRGIAGFSAKDVKRLKVINNDTVVYTLDKRRINQISQQKGISPEEVVSQIAEKLSKDADVEFATPDREVKMLSYSHENQWDEFAPPGGVDLEGPEGAWDVTMGDPSVVVAVLDTGIVAHPDLENSIVPGYSFVNDSDDNEDQGVETGYHGTHVAGTIAANGQIMGMAPHAKVQPVQVLGDYGSGMMSDILAGMYWAAGVDIPGVPPNPTPAKVINMSLGGDGRCDAATKSAISELDQMGVTVVVAAGNEDNDAYYSSPANCPGVITVSATNPEGHRSYYSNYGRLVDIAAPGGETHPRVTDGILSTVKDGYAYYQGTSMATPHVAGIVALLYSVNPNLDYTQVKDIIQRTATPFPDPHGTYSCVGRYGCGNGIINASHAVREAMASQ